MTKDQPPVVIWTIPLLVKMTIKTHPHTAAVVILANALAQTDVVTPVCHALVTNADSAKTAASNGLILPYTILPQVHKQLMILMPCTNWPNPANLLNPLNLQNDLLYCPQWMQLSFLLPHKWHLSLCQAQSLSKSLPQLFTQLWPLWWWSLQSAFLSSLSWWPCWTSWFPYWQPQNWLLSLHWWSLYQKPPYFTEESHRFFKQPTCLSTKWTLWLLSSFWRCQSLCVGHKPRHKSKPRSSFWWVWQLWKSYHCNLLCCTVSCLWQLWQWQSLIYWWGIHQI